MLELALRECLALGHNYIGTEHLLLGLVRENEGVAAQILRDFGADANTVRDEVIRQLGGAVASRPHPRPTSRSSLPEYVVGWALGAVTLGAGILIGWAIWG